MIDELKQDRLRVGYDEIAGPYLILPLSQLARVREVLDLHKVRYWPDSFAISFDGEPATVVVNFGKAGDAARIQQLLDEAD